MSTLDDRKDVFEKKFAHNEELAFKAEARCCKLFGLWIAEQMGLDGVNAETYAKEVVAVNLEEPGFDDVKRKVMPDLAAKNIDISEHVIDSQLEHFLDKAKEQIMAEADK
ncbi:MAG: DUF1476 domain-containing protein [Rhodospirillales bacterium]|nr:DUF1476 domain-containing protein [Rhodospirillales bacterium]